MNWFLIALWHVTKSGFYKTGDDQLSGWTEKKLQSTSQSQTWTKKRSWSLFGGLLPVWSTTSFLNPGKTITSEKYAQQLTRWTEKCNACSQHWSIESAQCLNARHTANTSEVERIGLQSFASSTIFTWPLPNQLPLLQTTWQLFAGKTPLQPAGGRKCFPRVQWIPKHGFLLYRNKQIYFSLAKNVLTVMVPVLINKDVLKPSYNDLKFTVRKHNYVCTNLIT